VRAAESACLSKIASQPNNIIFLAERVSFGRRFDYSAARRHLFDLFVVVQTNAFRPEQHTRQIFHPHQKLLTLLNISGALGIPLTHPSRTHIK
jgi:hypothetical protein